MKFLLKIFYLLGCFCWSNLPFSLGADQPDEQEAAVEETEEQEEEKATLQKPENSESTMAEKVMTSKMGNQETVNGPITVYVVPSCHHCVDFLSKDVLSFLDKYGSNICLIVKFIISTPEDVFALKLVANRAAKQLSSESAEFVFRNLLLPTLRQFANDKDLKKAAIDPPYTEEEIQASEFNEKGVFENRTIQVNAANEAEIAKITNKPGKPIEVPLILYDGQIFESFNKIIP